MVKNFKYFRIQIGGKTGHAKSSNIGKSTYRHSMYMQSKDSQWISRNTSQDDETTDAENKDNLAD